MLNRISKIIFLIIITELCLGGGGRLTALGPVSLRMVLFCVAIVLTALLLLKGKSIDRDYWEILGAYILMILIGVGAGWFNHGSESSIWEDVKPLLYFLMLPFFALTIDDGEITLASKIIKTSSLILAGLFFLSLILIDSGVLPFLTFYALTKKTQEFFYRGELSFFYKGFLFLGIGVIFYFFSELKKRNYLIVFLTVAIILSVTRGLLFSLAITSSIYFLYKKNNYGSLSFGAIALIILIWGNQFTISASRWLYSIREQKSFGQSSPYLFGDRNYSDEGRLAQIKEVGERVSLTSIFVGHGFGHGVPARPVHMEISYFEIFHKQGLIGLAFWGRLAWMLFNAYRKSNRSLPANAFFFSSLFVFVESATNQYFNNPIGMSFLLLSLIILNKLKNQS